MELLTTFYGRQIEGDFYTLGDEYKNEKLLTEIRNAHNIEKKKITDKLKKEIGIVNPEWDAVKDDFFASLLVNEYENEDEIHALSEKEAINNGYLKSILGEWSESKCNIYETPTHKAIMSFGKDMANDPFNKGVKVEIWKK